jgi:hypothetical protein
VSEVDDRERNSKLGERRLKKLSKLGNLRRFFINYGLHAQSQGMILMKKTVFGEAFHDKFALLSQVG